MIVLTAFRKLGDLFRRSADESPKLIVIIKLVEQGAWRTALMSLVRGDSWDGSQTEKFEEAVAAYIGVDNAVTGQRSQRANC